MVNQLEQLAQKALEGELTVEDRLAIYNLALTVAANELFRIEEATGGLVNPVSLLLIQQLCLLADPDVDHARVAAQITDFVEKANEGLDSGSGLITPR